MTKVFLAGAAAVSGGAVLILTGLLVGRQTDKGKELQGKDAGQGVFGLAKVWAVHLDVPAKEYEAMQPPKGKAFPGGPGGQPPAKDKQPGDVRPSEKNLFGLEFPWAYAELTANAKTFSKVGLRYSGDGSYFAAAGNLKRPLKIDLARFDNHDFHGLKAIHLHPGTQDSTRSREALAYAVFRAAGVPAQRAAFAEVTLTVPGKYDKEYVGLYTVVEDVDKAFLADRFKSDKGLLMKPIRMRGVDFLGEDWDKYKGQYQPMAEPTQEQAKRVIDFAKLVNQASDNQFQKEIGSYLDVEGFLRFMAANALVSNLDGFLALGNNYHLYLHQETNKFTFIPGDLEQAFAGQPFMGSPDQQMDLSLMHPYPGENKLVDRLLAIKEASEKYKHVVKELSASCFSKEELLKEIEAIEKATKEIIAKDASGRCRRSMSTTRMFRISSKLPPSLKLRCLPHRPWLAIRWQWQRHPAASCSWP